MKLLRDIPLKVTALFFAILLWFHVATNQTYDLEVSYNLAFVNMPDSLEYTAPPPSTATVLMRGSGKSLLRLLWGDRRWPIDMARAHAGRQQIVLSRDNIPEYGIKGLMPLGLVGDDTLTVFLDSMGHKVVPITQPLTRLPGDLKGGVDSVNVLPHERPPTNPRNRNIM